MRGKDARKTIKKIRRICNQNGIDVIVEPQYGKGSHHGLIFIDRKSDQFVRFSISVGDDISPGVQRNVLSYLEQLISKGGGIAAKAVLVTTVKEILQTIFKN